MDFKELSVKKYHLMLENKDITSSQVVAYYLERIQAYDHDLNAIICINDRALEEAEKLDLYYKEKGLKGKLHGVPILLKDNVETSDMPTTAGSKSLQGYMAKEDAPVVKLLKEAGAIIIAKTNLHEFAIWGETISSIQGQTLNPYDLTRTPGGSSGGTGASVAADFGMIGIGTDTINSVRSPSSANALVGIRPSAGLISKKGVVPYSNTQDALGPIARSLEDAKVLLEVLSDKDYSDLQVDFKTLRVGVLRDFFGQDDCHQEINKAMDHQIDKLRAQGVYILDLKDVFDTAYLVKDVSVHLYELKDHLNAYLRNLPDHVSVHSLEEILSSGLHHEGIKDNLIKASELSTSSEDYRKRLERRDLVKDKLKALFEKNQLDVILYPHQKRLVCKIGQSQLERNGVLASVTGYPSICIPAGFSSVTSHAPIGVPIGMELLGPLNSEEKLMAIASKLEGLTHVRKAPIINRKG
ncbi:amidase [Acidaminobacter sp. JC074]|uniref:amidase n=1 Tax=Acidaminobacter sp. JC074 TaxID=2530199 RepID=UPI001F0F0310|nr:amidase [Acidaminobacter sp. JC074]MCH4890101.1 amidase [Acidaminobacter sp. JC074]